MRYLFIHCSRDGPAWPRPRGRNPHRGFTLVEVMVSLLVIAMLAAALVRSVAMSRTLTQASSQHVSAFGLCQAKLEEIRSQDYADIITTNFPVETSIRLTHLGGASQQALTCDRSVAILPMTAPLRKEVLVTVQWQFRGRTIQEQLLGVIYP